MFRKKVNQLRFECNLLRAENMEYERENAILTETLRHTTSQYVKTVRRADEFVTDIEIALRNHVYTVPPDDFDGNKIRAQMVEDDIRTAIEEWKQGARS